jgi:hypothetical protein
VVVGAQDEPPTDVCEPVAVNLSLLAANVSRRVWIVSPNVSPRKLMFASRDNYVCKPQQVGALVIFWVAKFILFHDKVSKKEFDQINVEKLTIQTKLEEEKSRVMYQFS